MCAIHNPARSLDLSNFWIFLFHVGLRARPHNILPVLQLHVPSQADVGYLLIHQNVPVKDGNEKFAKEPCVLQCSVLCHYAHGK